MSADKGDTKPVFELDSKGNVRVGAGQARPIFTILGILVASMFGGGFSHMYLSQPTPVAAPAQETKAIQAEAKAIQNDERITRVETHLDATDKNVEKHRDQIAEMRLEFRSLNAVITQQLTDLDKKVGQIAEYQRQDEMRGK